MNADRWLVSVHTPQQNPLSHWERARLRVKNSWGGVNDYDDCYKNRLRTADLIAK
jgi:hypothetical protein